MYAQIFAFYFSSHFLNAYMLFLHGVAHFNYITLIYLDICRLYSTSYIVTDKIISSNHYYFICIVFKKLLD